METEDETRYDRDERGYDGGSRASRPSSFVEYRVIRPKGASDGALTQTRGLLNALRAARDESAYSPDRVFTNRLDKERASVRSLENLTRERGRLLDTAVRELDERLNEVKNWLSFARRPYSGRTAQDIVRFEKMLHDLESERREAYLSFWKDLAELRKELIDSAFEYRSARDRSSLLGDGAGAYG